MLLQRGREQLSLLRGRQVMTLRPRKQFLRRRRVGRSSTRPTGTCPLHCPKDLGHQGLNELAGRWGCNLGWMPFRGRRWAKRGYEWDGWRKRRLLLWHGPLLSWWCGWGSSRWLLLLLWWLLLLLNGLLESGKQLSCRHRMEITGLGLVTNLLQKGGKHPLCHDVLCWFSFGYLVMLRCGFRNIP